MLHNAGKPRKEIMQFYMSVPNRSDMLLASLFPQEKSNGSTASAY